MTEPSARKTGKREAAWSGILKKAAKRVAQTKKRKNPNGTEIVQEPEHDSIAEREERQRIKRAKREARRKPLKENKDADEEKCSKAEVQDEEDGGAESDSSSSSSSSPASSSSASSSNSADSSSSADDSENEERDPSEEISMLQRFPDVVTKPLQKLKHSTVGLPDWLAQPTTIPPESTQPIADARLGLSKRIIERCREFGIEELFAVQTAVVPLLLQSRSTHPTRPAGDLCVSAPTGSGKTLAYVLPMVESLALRAVIRLRGLVILPTRDLVSQVKETFDAFCKGTDLKVGVVTGQTSFATEQGLIVAENDQILEGGSSKVDILIATPGRLIDHITSTKNFTLQHLRFLVIDEADRLLNQSYNDWLSHMLQSIENRGNIRDTINLNEYGIPIHDAVATCLTTSQFDLAEARVPQLQKLLFSATLTRNPAKIASLHLQNPRYIAVWGNTSQKIEQADASTDDISTNLEKRYVTPAGLTEHMTVCATSEKPLMALYLLMETNPGSTLCFTKSVESAHRLFRLILLFDEKQQAASGKSSGIRAAEYSSDLPQVERKSIIKRFKKGEITLLICSDLISRGMDIDLIDTVISYDAPLYIKKYIHRVGRTARAGRQGTAYTLVEEQEARHFKEMMRSAGHMGVLQKLNIKPSMLEPHVENYKAALEALRKDMGVHVGVLDVEGEERDKTERRRNKGIEKK